MMQKNTYIHSHRTYFYTFIFLFFIAPFAAHAAKNSTDLIIFSYDRPLQLHTLLNSVNTYISNIGDIFIIYRTSDQTFDKAYHELQELFPQAHFAPQGANPKNDFKPILLACLAATDASHVIFTTDDDIFTESVDIATCVNALEANNAYGFYLRLGSNITYSYFANKELKVPPFDYLEPDILSFSFQNGTSYWGYPNNVNMTIYKKSTIMPALNFLSYYSPNSLESRWARLYPIIGNGVCFAHSKGINIPLNLVQDDWHNKHEAVFTTQELLDLWNKNYTIDLAQFHYIDNNAAHMAYKPTFITRNRYNDR